MDSSNKLDGLQVKRYFLTISLIIFTVILVWTCNRTPGAATLFHSQQQFDVGSKECNYGVGKWVPDNNTRPIYSGLQCKRWLSALTNCRLMRRRTDFSYEGFRWQPENCSLPEFNNDVFLNRMKNKTIAFMGDSLGRQQFQSMMCMATGGGRLDPEVEDVGSEYDFVKPVNAFLNGSTAYRFRSTNTTILFYWSVTLCKLESSPMSINSSEDPQETTGNATGTGSGAGYFALHVDRPEEFLTQSLHKFHVLVLNTKHHWSEDKLKRNRWVIHRNGLAVKNKTQQSNARNLAVSSVVNWVDSQLPRHPGLKVFFRTLSPRHFINGDWNTGGKCDSTTPLAYGNRIFPGFRSYDSPVADAVRGTGVKLLDVTGLSRLRDEAHVSKFRLIRHVQYDCLHWCLPGVPDEWNKILLAQI